MGRCSSMSRSAGSLTKHGICQDSFERPAYFQIVARYRQRAESSAHGFPYATPNSNW